MSSGSLPRGLRCASLSLLLMLLVGCQSEVDRLAEEQGPAVEAKRAQVAAVIDAALDLPPASKKHQEWVAEKERLRRIDLMADSDRLEEEVRVAFKKQADQLREEVDQLGEEAKLEVDDKIVFVEGPGQNAATLMLTSGAYVTDSEEEGEETAEESTEAAAEATNEADTAESELLDPGAELRERNLTEAAWYTTGPPGGDVQDAKNWYHRWQTLEYLLVVRPTEIAKPKHAGKDDNGSETYSMGAIGCDAFLFRLGDEPLEPLGSFYFQAANKRTALSFGEYEMFMPEDPQAAVRSLTTRLYETGHEFAAAIAAELSDKIEAEYHITRDLLGTRLER